MDAYNNELHEEQTISSGSNRVPSADSRVDETIEIHQFTNLDDVEGKDVVSKLMEAGEASKGDPQQPDFGKLLLRVNSLFDYSRLRVNRIFALSKRVLQVYEYYEGITDFICDQFDMVS